MYESEVDVSEGPHNCAHSCTTDRGFFSDRDVADKNRVEGQIDDIKYEESEDESEKSDNDFFHNVLRTNAAGETYIRLGDYVYVRDDEREEEEYMLETKDDPEGCPICCFGDHFNFECPWLNGVPQGEKVGRRYGIICKGCAKWGSACCPEGGKAVLKKCGMCFRSGHVTETCPHYKYMPLSSCPEYP